MAVRGSVEKSTGPFGGAEDGGGVGVVGWADSGGVEPFDWAEDGGVASAGWAKAAGLKSNPEPGTIGMTALPIRTDRLAVSHRAATARRGVE